jgi:hypothetical protein
LQAEVFRIVSKENKIYKHKHAKIIDIIRSREREYCIHTMIYRKEAIKMVRYRPSLESAMNAPSNGSIVATPAHVFSADAAVAIPSPRGPVTYVIRLHVMP